MSGSPISKLKSILRRGAYSVLSSPLLAKAIPFNSPPLLILSFPRSGSSWVGKVLSTSRSTAYLREPITQQYIFKHGGRHALVDLKKNRTAYSIYRKLSDAAFQGIPPSHVNVVNNYHDFAYPQRKAKRLLIKEVNPRAISFYCSTYKPTVLLLLRHPAAVALSFYRLGWLESADVQVDTANPSASAWEKFGHAYGSIMQNAIETLKADGHHEIVVYRHLAENPRENFRNLFGALELELPEDYDAVIDRYCYSAKETTSRAEIERTSRNMIFKWRQELTDQQITDLRKGFLQSKMEYYRDAADWEPLDHGANS
jgi:hypothetical protein